jgi:hypothetical protein
VEPLFSALVDLLIKLNLSFQLCDPIFGRAKAMRELLGYIESMFAIRCGL